MTQHSRNRKEKSAEQLTVEAANYFRQATALGEKMVAMQPNDQLYEGLLTAAKFNENEYLVMSKDYQAALRVALEGLQNYENKLKSDPANAENKLNTTYVYGSLGGIYLRLNDLSKAEECYRKMTKLFDEVIAQDSENLDTRQKRWQAAYSYADELLRAGKIEQARQIYALEYNAVAKSAQEKDEKFAAAMRGFMLAKTADCDMATAQTANLPAPKKRELYDAATIKYQTALESWSNSGAQIAPGVTDAQRIEIIKNKLNICRKMLS